MSNAVAAGDYEPTLTLMRLPGCAACGCRHPLAFDPPLEQDTCPECGTPSRSPDSHQTVPVVVNGPLSRALALIGRSFNRLTDKG